MVIAPLYAVPSTGSPDLNQPFVVGYSAFQDGLSVVRTTRVDAIAALILDLVEARLDRIDAAIAEDEGQRLHVSCVCHADA
jgi:hypothetical protein